MGETEGASHRKLAFTRDLVHVSMELDTDLKHKTGFIQLLLRWFSRLFVRSCLKLAVFSQCVIVSCRPSQSFLHCLIGLQGIAITKRAGRVHVLFLSF